MEDIRVYDFEFNLLHIEHDFVSANWSLKYNNIGTFEGHFPLKSGIVPVIMNNRYLVIIQGDKQAIVTGVQAESDFAIYGRTVNWLLTKRTVAKFKTEDLKGTTLPKIAGHVLEESFIINENYPVKDMKLEWTVDFDIGRFWRNTRNSAYDVIHDLCVRANHSGHELRFDHRIHKWILHLYQGKELPLMVSEANRNAKSITFTRDCLDFATDGWYERAMVDKGEWDASNNSPKIDFTKSDTSRMYEYYRVSVDGTQNGVNYKSGDFILCGADGYFNKVTEINPVWERISNSELKGIYRWEEKLTGTTPTEAWDNLAKKKMNEDISAELQKMKFGEDYNLGDVVRVQMKCGDSLFTYKKRIAEISVGYENNLKTIQPLFSDDEQEIVQETEPEIEQEV